MITPTKPEMSIDKTGNRFKVLKVTGKEGSQMPSHFSTKEAVIIVLQGEAILNLTETKIYLKVNDTAIIPANEPHTLEIKGNFHATVIMEVDSAIQFVK